MHQLIEKLGFNVTIMSFKGRFNGLLVNISNNNEAVRITNHLIENGYGLMEIENTIVFEF